MLVELALPYADVRAADLCHTLGATREPALEVLTAGAAGWRVELRLLGCSHQALIDDGAELSETVSCRPGVPGDLPSVRSGGAATAHYEFRARVQRLEAPDFRAEADRVLTALAAEPHGLAGLFPSPDGGPAFTALRLRAQESAVAWTTWHAYPQTGEIVVTDSRLAR